MSRFSKSTASFRESIFGRFGEWNEMRETTLGVGDLVKSYKWWSGDIDAYNFAWLKSYFGVFVKFGKNDLTIGYSEWRMQWFCEIWYKENYRMGYTMEN